MSKSSFHAHFKAVTGLTPGQYQKDVRLLEARRRILEGRAPISAVAFDVGGPVERRQQMMWLWGHESHALPHSVPVDEVFELVEWVWLPAGGHDYRADLAPMVRTAFVPEASDVTLAAVQEELVRSEVRRSQLLAE